MVEGRSLLGRTLGGRWRLDEVLGRGGMGTVYRAVELAVGRPVAVKVLHPSMVDQPEIIARFQREAKVMSRLAHPNLVPLLAVEQDEDLHYLVMKFAEGERLSARIKAHGRHTARESLPILAQLGSALDYLHARGIVHRDVKPGNVILSSGGHLTLLDFGISRPAGSALTTAGSVLGTPQYMAPEQALGGAIDHRADLYALGAIAYQLLTGVRVFDEPDTFEAIRRHLFETPMLASEKSAAVSEAVARVIARSLAKRPEDRFDSASDFTDGLVTALAIDSTEQSSSSVSAPAGPAASQETAREPIVPAPPASDRVSTVPVRTVPAPSGNSHERIAPAPSASDRLSTVPVRTVPAPSDTTHKQVGPTHPLLEHVSTVPQVRTMPSPGPGPGNRRWVAPVAIAVAAAALVALVLWQVLL